MKIDDFALAATTNDLTREPEARGKADFIEFRMDKAKDPIKQLESYNGNLPIIATNRNRWFGGMARDQGRLDTLFAASRFDDVAYVDIELETARAKEWVLDEFYDNNVDLIISHHDFHTTPDKEVLTAILRDCANYGEIAKVATYPDNPSDTLSLLTSLYEVTQDGIKAAGIAMGETGNHTRVIGHLYGSKVGYAPLVDDESDYAPGQIPLGKLAALIESTKITGINLDRIEAVEEDVLVPPELTNSVKNS